MALTTAKTTLAGQIQRLRTEQTQLDGPTKRIEDLTKRTQGAVAAGKQALDAANAIAQLENEQVVRRTTIERLDTNIEKLLSEYVSKD